MILVQKRTDCEYSDNNLMNFMLFIICWATVDEAANWLGYGTIAGTGIRYYWTADLDRRFSIIAPCTALRAVPF
jgi:hypothetical protein